MLALEVEYLLGRAVAARHDDRRSVEWPPHPARLFSALTAAFEESELAEEAHPGHDAADAALRWLERQPAPALYANPPTCDVGRRDVSDVFVPMSDASALDVLPEKRSRQMRWFPAFAPADPVVRFIWPQAQAADELRLGLSALAERVTYLGHSMSPVRVALADGAPAPTLLPDATGEIDLRTVGEGRLEHLRDVHRLRVVNESIQPRLGKVTSYAQVTDGTPAVRRSLFRRWMAFQRLTGPRIPLEATAGLVAMVRRAVLGRYPDPLPEWLCGHAPDNSPSRQAHLAVVPLPHVAHHRADGHLLGFALLAPDHVSDQDWETLEDALAGPECPFDELVLGAAGEWGIAPVNAMERTAAALRAATWRPVADTWASVTPVVFDRHPKTRPGKDALAVLGAACAAIGLPMPVEVRFGPVSAHRGVPRAADFVPPKQAQGKFVAHVWMRFAQPVGGPVLIGAGRHVGFGLLRPWTGSESR